MSEVAICKYNQKGYCKFKNKCRKHHENKTCPADNCRQKDCFYRHPKVCRNFSKEGFCLFGEDCAYKHNIRTNPCPNESETIKRLEKEVANLKSEIAEKNQANKKLENNIRSINEQLSNTLYCF